MENFVYCIILLYIYPGIKTIVMIMVIISFDSKGNLIGRESIWEIFHSERKDNTHVIIGTTDCRDVSKDIIFGLLIFAWIDVSVESEGRFLFWSFLSLFFFFWLSNHALFVQTYLFSYLFYTEYRERIDYSRSNVVISYRFRDLVPSSAHRNLYSFSILSCCNIKLLV